MQVHYSSSLFGGHKFEVLHNIMSWGLVWFVFLRSSNKGPGPEAREKTGEGGGGW